MTVTKKKIEPMVEVDKSKTLFGNWVVDSRIDRKHDRNNGEERGMYIMLRPSLTYRPEVDWDERFCAKIMLADCTLQTALEIENRMAQCLAPIAERFLNEMEEELRRFAKVEELRLAEEEVTRSCKKCDTGLMVATGEYNCTMVPLYFHLCDNCGSFEKISGVKYPHKKEEGE